MKFKIVSILILGVFLNRCQWKQQSQFEREEVRWVFLGQSEKGSAFFYDPCTIRQPDEDIVNVWVKVVPSDGESIYTLLMALVREGVIPLTEEIRKTKDIAYSFILYEVYCMEQRIIAAASQDYDEQGNVIYSCADEKELSLYLMEFDSLIAPGTIWAVLSGTVCETASQEALRSGDHNSNAGG